MKIIYYSFWGTYAAYLMAAIHTGVYPAGQQPCEDLIKRQFELCRKYAGRVGNLIYVGMDDQFREVYCIGCRQHGGLVVRAIDNINRIFEVDEAVRFIPAVSREGVLPYLMEHRFLQQSLTFSKGRIYQKCFQSWFNRQYKSCLRAVEEIKVSLKDEINR